MPIYTKIAWHIDGETDLGITTDPGITTKDTNGHMMSNRHMYNKIVKATAGTYAKLAKGASYHSTGESSDDKSEWRPSLVCRQASPSNGQVGGLDPKELDPSTQNFG